MARARNIKPGLFKNEILGVADPLLTILFESLWCLADKAGRLEDRPLRIKAETFPYREGLDVNVYLTELERMGFICRYVVQGMALIQVLNFLKHQNPHKTEKASELPEMSLNSVSCEITVIDTLENGSRPADSLIPDSLNIDSAAFEKTEMVKFVTTEKKSRAPSKTLMPKDFGISDRVKKWALEHDHVNLDSHFANFLSAVRRKGYTYVDWDEAFMEAVRKNWAGLENLAANSKKFAGAK